MSEENRKPGAEISEAELANVSGATSPEEPRYIDIARPICLHCGRSNGLEHCSANKEYSLGPYLLQNGKDSVQIHTYKKTCPYFVK